MTEISRNGRTVAVHDLTPDAPADAPVVLMCHAAPGSGSFDPDPEATAAAGIRLIEVDRPGYGGSDPVKDDFATIGLAADDAVEAPEGVRFLIRSRLFTDQEYEALEETSTG